MLNLFDSVIRGLLWWRKTMVIKLIEGRVIGLTHYTDHVTMEEFQEINAIAERLTSQISEEFHFIIDNQNINIDRVLSLSDLQNAAPYMNHPLLRAVVMILPRQMDVDASTLPIEHNGDVHLKLVNDVDEAVEYLSSADESLEWDVVSRSFFP